MLAIIIPHDLWSLGRFLCAIFFDDKKSACCLTRNVPQSLFIIQHNDAKFPLYSTYFLSVLFSIVSLQYFFFAFAFGCCRLSYHDLKIISCNSGDRQIKPPRQSRAANEKKFLDKRISPAILRVINFIKHSKHEKFQEVCLSISDTVSGRKKTNSRLLFKGNTAWKALWESAGRESFRWIDSLKLLMAFSAIAIVLSSISRSLNLIKWQLDVHPRTL